MTPMEIALLVIGVIIFILSFFLPDSKVKKTEKEIQEEQDEIRKLMEHELDGMKLKVNEATTESVDYAVDKAERSLEKVSNEKIMAVNEYGQTIIEEINKNHQEVMFLYDMLKDKHADLTNQVRKADAAAREIENLSASAISASKGLQQELTVISVTKKGLTDEQKAVFDEVEHSENEGIAGEIPSIVPETPSFETGNVGQLEKVQPMVQNNVETIPVEAVPEKRTEVRDMLSGAMFTASGEELSPMNTPVSSVPANKLPMTKESMDTASQQPVNNNQKILMLHEQGMATVDIARELKLGVGEVKLVIDLFK